MKKLRSWLIPLPWSEVYQALPLFALFFLSSFVYNLLRPLKISLIVTAPNAGGDVIPFLKLWAILPASFFFAYIYTILSARFNRTTVFYTLISIFIGFFLLFIILFPIREQLEFNSLADLLEPILPQGLHGLITIIRHWFVALFYVMAELWGNMILTVMCWGFVNECISVNQAKKFYALIAVSADSAGIFSGQFGNLIQINEFNLSLPYGKTAWEQTILVNLSYVLLIGVVIIFLYNKINSPTNILFVKDPNMQAKPKALDSEIKMTLWECLKYTAKSPYMLSLAMIVVAYFMSYNLFDVIWTEELHQRFSEANELNKYLNTLTSFTGLLAASIAFFVSGNVVRHLGWRFAAMITPVVMCCTTVCFFSALLCKQYGLFPNSILTSISIAADSMHVIIWFGTIQYCLCRASKYTVFDATKEMAFIPLQVQEQRKGKVVIDTIVSRLSKTGSSVIFHALLICCGTLAATVPYVGAIILMIIPFWIWAINTLHKITKKTIDL